MIEKKYGALSSSVNPANLSLTLKAFVPMVLFIVTYFSLDITEGDIDQIINAICAIVSGVVFLYGFIRKFIK